MSRALILLASLVLAGPMGARPINGTTEDEKVIRRLQSDFVATWNKHDAYTLSMFWAEEGDYIGRFGRRLEGRAEIERLFSLAFSSILKEANLSSSVRSIRFPTPDVAVVNGSFRIVGARTREGQERPSWEGLNTWVLVRRNGKWWIFAHRVFGLRLRYEQAD